MISEEEMIQNTYKELEKAKDTIIDLQDELTLANLKIQALQDSIEELINMGKDFVATATMSLRG
jgi:hypothetical protein